MNTKRPATGIKRFVLLALPLALLFLFQQAGNAQVVNKETKKRIRIGVGLYDDIWLNFPSGVETRTINQGVQLFGMYHIPFGKSIFGFSIGLGLTSHNAYGNFIVNGRADSTWFTKIPDSVNYKRSKMSLVYLELPVEFSMKTKSKVSAAIGFKIGFLVGSSTKYVGDDDILPTMFPDVSLDKNHQPDNIRMKQWGIKNLEQFTYGPTVRVGYAWFNVTATYMLSSVFNSNGPNAVPLSVGFVLVPF